MEWSILSRETPSEVSLDSQELISKKDIDGKQTNKTHKIFYLSINHKISTIKNFLWLFEILF
jgi:hypothetical protein